LRPRSVDSAFSSGRSGGDLRMTLPPSRTASAPARRSSARPGRVRTSARRGAPTRRSPERALRDRELLVQAEELDVAARDGRDEESRTPGGLPRPQGGRPRRLESLGSFPRGRSPARAGERLQEVWDSRRSGNRVAFISLPRARPPERRNRPAIEGAFVCVRTAAACSTRAARSGPACCSRSPPRSARRGRGRRTASRRRCWPSRGRPSPLLVAGERPPEAARSSPHRAAATREPGEESAPAHSALRPAARARRGRARRAFGGGGARPRRLLLPALAEALEEVEEERHVEHRERRLADHAAMIPVRSMRRSRAPIARRAAAAEGEASDVMMIGRSLCSPPRSSPRGSTSLLAQLRAKETGGWRSCPEPIRTRSRSGSRRRSRAPEPVAVRAPRTPRGRPS